MRIIAGIHQGKYHRPGKGERIFLFLDLRSSTAIAEQIGDDRYFRMLRCFYELANEVIINRHGEIYQYVGDEIVVSWEKTRGLEEVNCIRCFYAIREAVAEKKDFFLEQFSVVPEFKGGIHFGEVMTGEIGTIKKDIVYSGDVLNTTARIVALCNKYQESLLISGELYRALNNPGGNDINYLDSPALKGKAEPFPIYRVHPAIH